MPNEEASDISVQQKRLLELARREGYEIVGNAAKCSCESKVTEEGTEPAQPPSDPDHTKGATQ